MSQSDADVKLANLLSQADEALSAQQLAKTASILKEASQLEPEHEGVKSRWLALQRHESGGGAVVALRLYTTNRRNEDGQKALQGLKQKQLSAAEAAEAYSLLSGVDDKLGLRDELNGALLGQQAEARKLIAKRLSPNATDLFDRMFQAGDESFRAFVGIPLDADAWSSEDAQRTAQQDVFRLCIATLMEAGVERPDRLMRAVARQLAIQPASIVGLIDGDVVDVILSDLDIRLESSLRSQAMLSASKLLEATSEKGEGLFADFVTNRVARQTNDDLIAAFSAAAAVFPIVPAIVAKLFLTDGFVQQLVPNLEKNSDAAAAGKR